MRMPVQMPGTVMGAVPYAHGIVAEHDRLAIYGDFCKIVEPREVFSQLARFFVVIAGHRNNLLAADLPPVLQNARFASNAEISEEIKNVARLY